MVMMMKHVLVAALTLFTLAGCADDTADGSTDEACPTGTTRSPVTGLCVEPTTPEEDAGATNNANSQNSETPDLGDVTPEEDMAIAAPDMGEKEPDMAVEVDMAPPAEELVRFLAAGDTGEGSEMQRKVGQAMATACNTYGGCDFGLLLGDNVYDSGVDSVNDARFDSMFVVPYGHLQIPFYAVLGNHDLGGDGLGLDLDFDKANYQVGYSNVNPMWRMPSPYYQVTEGPAWLVGLNTTDIFFDQAADQKNDVLNWLASAPADKWKIAFGHHPYISNGPHGNAGDYEGLPFVPIANGEHVKDFMDDALCGKFDLYICGHDHSRQDLEATCGTEFVVSGAGAKTTDLEGSNPNYFESDKEGFLMVDVTPSKITLRFFNEDAVMEHERVITR